MRILIATHYWRPHRGGIETAAWEQARRLVQRGHQVSVVTSRLKGDPPLSQEDGFPVHRVAACNFLEPCGIPYPIFSPRLLPLIARLMTHHDVILANSHTFLSSVASAVVAQHYRRPLVVLQHNPFVEYRFPWDVVEHGADFLLGRYTLRSATRVLAVSQYTRQYAQKLTKRRQVEVLSNGVDNQRFSPVAGPEQKRSIRTQLGLPCDSFLLFTVRRLVFRNGLDTLLQACCRLRDQNDIFVLIGGAGPERPALERFIRQERLRNVRLAGFISEEDLPEYYRAADAFVLPTRTGEGFGLVLLEALATGIPVITTQGGAQQEIVEHGGTGLLVPPESPERLAETILQLSNEPWLVKEMGHRGRGRAVEMDWDRCVDRLEEILTDVTSRPRQCPASAGTGR